MPRIALHLALLACILLAGCNGTAPSTTETTTPPIVTETPPPTTEQSEYDCPPSTDYEPKPLPERPENFTRNTATEFAVAYEEAYVWNDNAPRAEANLGVSTRAKITERVENGYIVHVDGSATYTTCSGSARSVADAWLHTNYFVNDTLLVRRAQPDHWTSNPWRNNGTVLERWND